MVVDDETWATSAAKESVIAGVFTVEKCNLTRARTKTAMLRLSKQGHSHHIWLKFEDEQQCNIWEKALTFAAVQRVVGISDFEFISPIGKGASGKVFLVTDRKTGEKLALKIIDKSKVFESRSGFRHALDERLALEMVDGHPFFSRLRYAFQTRSFFYLAIDFYDGGDLYQYLRTHHGRLREAQVRNVAAEVSLALEHLHKLGFVYRDLKPENVLLDSKGHVRLADFGLCKLLPDKSLTNTICGTHTYAAPEMLSVRNYGISIDLWAFGVFVYHILRGRTPYEARDLDQVIANMNNRRIRFSSSTSPELVSMIKKLLDWNPETRLGCGAVGMEEVRDHSFFKGMNWRGVYLRENEGDGLFTKASNKGVCHRPPHPKKPSEATSTEGSGGDSSNTVNDSSQTGAGSPQTGKMSGISTGSGSATGLNGRGRDGTSSSDAESGPRKNKRISRPRGAHLGSSLRREGRGWRGSNELTESISLRDQMVAAAEQDDLRNFDMSEWGKISVDNDHDDVNYGDSSLWPINRARRRLVEDERMIAGFGYCSGSAPFGLPDNL